MLARWREEVKPRIPGLVAGPASVNPGSGNVTLALTPPDEGPAVAAVALAYNSVAPAVSEAGYGWGICLKQSVTSLSSTVALVASGDGTVLRYVDKDVNGYYRGPGGTTDALRFDSGSGTWTRTAADESVVHFNPQGRADYLGAPGGKRWTLAYDGSGKVVSARDWFGQRTSLAYDGSSGYLRRVQQPSGRITSIAVDGSGHLVKAIRADGTRVTLSYNAEHRLTGYTDPRGKVTEYRYTESRLKEFITPTGGRTTFTYFSGGTEPRTR